MASSKVSKRKKKPIKGSPLRINQKYQSEQVREILSLFDDMAAEVDEVMTPIMESKKTEKLVNSAMDGVTDTASSALSKLRRKWNKIFLRKANSFTNDLVVESKRRTANGVNASLKKAGLDQTIKIESMSQRTRDIVNAASKESVSQIKTISSAYMDSAASAVNYSVTQASSNFANLKEFFDGALTSQYKTHKNKAKNLALDQTRNVYNSLATERMRDVGMTKYIWRHAGGSVNPREYHKFVLNGQTFDINNPPVIDLKTGKKGNPGDIWHCHCYKEMIVDFSQFE